MKMQLLVTSALLLALVVHAPKTFGEEKKTDSLSKENVEFIQKAASSDEAEIQLSRVANQRSNTATIKTFAQKMIEDHTKNAAEVKTLAAKKNVQAPAELDKKHEEILEELRTTTDLSKLDEHYIKAMIDDHEDAVELYEKGTQSKDPDIQAFTQKKLPILKHHHEMARNLEEKK